MSVVHDIRIIISVSLLFWLVGCERASHTQAPALEYQQRLAYVLERDLPAADEIRRMSLPEHSATQISLKPLQLSLLDSFRLDDCELSSLIANRNSALGRLRTGLRQFHSDRQIATALQACAFHIANDNP